MVKGMQQRVLRPISTAAFALGGFVVCATAMLANDGANGKGPRDRRGGVAKPQSEGRPVRLLQYVSSNDLLGICDVEVSADRRCLYAASFQAGAITQFDVDSASGLLTHVKTIKDPRLRGTTDFRLFPDGRSAVACACFAKTTVLFTRQPANGHLAIGPTFTAGDEATLGLEFPVDVAISPDGQFVYVADSSGNGTRDRPKVKDGNVTIFQRTPDGKLNWIDSNFGTDQCFSGARGVLCHPDGRRLFVTSHIAGTLVVCDRDQQIGLLKVRKVFRQGESGVNCLEGAMTAALSPDGQFLYTAAGNFEETGGIGVFHVARDGATTLVQQFVNGEEGFENFRGGNKVIVSPDGGRAFATATVSGSLACFERDAKSGRLRHIETLAPGVTSAALTPLPRAVPRGKSRKEKPALPAGTEAETNTVRLPGANGLAFGPGGRFLYVACEEDHAIAVFEVQK